MHHRHTRRAAFSIPLSCAHNQASLEALDALARSLEAPERAKFERAMRLQLGLPEPASTDAPAARANLA